MRRTKAAGLREPPATPREAQSAGFSFCARRSRQLRFEHQLLYSPRLDLRDEDLIRIPAVHHVDNLESARLLAGMAKAPEDRSIELHLVNLPGDVPRAGSVAVRIRIRRK